MTTTLLQGRMSTVSVNTTGIAVSTSAAAVRPYLHLRRYYPVRV